MPDWTAKNSNRKLRLFTVAVCRRIWHLFRDDRCRDAVEIAERMAEEPRIHVQELVDAERAAEDAHIEAPSDLDRGAFDAAIHVVNRDMSLSPRDAASRAADAVEAHAQVDPALARKEECKQQSILVRDIFGNPFRPVTLDPRWLTSTVVDLARLIYDERQFERIPILADALMDAGCDSEEIIQHCQGSGPHVRGCWVVDLLLAKA